MNTKLFRTCFACLFLMATPSSPAKEKNPELRLALGDEIQESRTTSVNWPGTRKMRVASAPTVEPETESTPKEAPQAPVVKRFKVLIDVGHGGHDYGAAGFYGILEKELCLRIARQAKSRLERAANLADFPLEVQLSRDSDHFIPLRDRVREANDWSADLFVSIHANSSPVPRARGFEVYFLSNEASDADASRIARQENGEGGAQALSKGVLSILSDLKTNTHILESSRFAEAVYSSLSSMLRPNGKGVRQAPFTVLSGTQMPALLVEVGYLTNPVEAEALNRGSYQVRLASGIAEGVLNFALQMRRISRASSLRLGNKRTT